MVSTSVSAADLETKREKVLVVGQFLFGHSSGILIHDVHIVQSTVSWGPEEGSLDVLLLAE